jgi:hypothetical protein
VHAAGNLDLPTHTTYGTQLPVRGHASLTHDDLLCVIGLAVVTAVLVVPGGCRSRRPVWRSPVGAPAACEERAGETYALDADQRRRIIRCEEDRWFWFVVRVGVPGVAWLSEWSRKHPFGAAPADDDRRCYGQAGNTSFFGAGMVNALGTLTAPESLRRGPPESGRPLLTCTRLGRGLQA